MKILAISGSNSSASINTKLVTYAASLLDQPETEVYCMRDFEMPLFGVDLEKEVGQLPLAQHFLDKISACDRLIVSLPEHNGSYTAAFKNVFDWASRIEKDVFQQKPTLLMATSPGGRGGKSVLELATSNLVRYGMQIIGTFSLPGFYDNFDEEAHAVKNEAYDLELREKVRNLQNFSHNADA